MVMRVGEKGAGFAEVMYIEGVLGSAHTSIHTFYCSDVDTSAAPI